jgi:glycosyltransferase involved in cell wall biosynthesis
VGSKLSVVFGFRDRDTLRVKRCLDSLTSQTFRDFDVLFVDYGSQPETVKSIRPLIESYTFARYIYTDTRGWPWNRAQALNIAGRQVKSDYIMTTDVDMIYPPDFLETVMSQADLGKELHVVPHLLPEDFSDWEHMTQYQNRLPTMNQNAKGACQCIATEVYQRIRGFDEFYRYYGTEDRDINLRLRSLGLEEVWLTDQTCMFHQWHGRSDYMTPQFMPEGYWSRALNHLVGYETQAVRNDEHWGAICTTEQRLAFRFLDLETSQLKDQDELHQFNESPYSNQSVVNMLHRFRELPSGHALAVNRAFVPTRSPWSDRLIHYGNRILSRLHTQSRIDYPANRLHSFLVELIDLNPQLVADYFLGFPALNGVSLLVRR